MIKLWLVLCMVAGCLAQQADPKTTSDHASRRKKDLSPHFSPDQDPSPSEENESLKPGRVTAAYILKKSVTPRRGYSTEDYPSSPGYGKYSKVKSNIISQNTKYLSPESSQLQANKFTDFEKLEGDANYEFSYDVLAPGHNLELGHAEKREGDETKGRYYALLPDGRRQTVEYTAGKYGYRPVITYQNSLGHQLSGGYQQGKRYENEQINFGVKQSSKAYLPANKYQPYDVYQLLKQSSEIYKTYAKPSDINNLAVKDNQHLSLYLSKSRKAPYLLHPS